MVNLWKDGTAWAVMVAHLICKTFHGPRIGRMEVNHKDGDKRNNRPTNLEWITPSANVVHAVRTKLRIPARGERVSGSKLKPADVLRIRNLRAAGWTHKLIAKEMGICVAQASNVARGKHWKHITSSTVLEPRVKAL